MNFTGIIPLFIVFAYIIGSIPTSLILGKVFHGVDIRNHGSGNLGATNTFRVLGRATGIPVLIVDMLKGWFAMSLCFYLELPEEQMQWIYLAMGTAAVSGHVFPLFAGFKGGKGVATLFGVFCYLLTIPVLLSLGVFLIVFILSGYVSLGSILAGIAFPFFSLLAVKDTSMHMLVFTFLIMLFILFTHRKNIRRLLRGEENRFDLFKKRKHNQP